MAVKILEELSKDGYIPIVIQSSAVSLWDDYKHLFLPGKQHVLLFDDANKSVINLNYLLNKLEATQSYSAKVIITSRDYVKKQVAATLNNYAYREINISEFKDEEIGNIIVAALPNLKHHRDIERKIVDLAKGNARIALMATYSVTPDSETNYLRSPVLLYEKYFKKISEELGIFNDPIVLKALAIVSFFGVLDRNNDDLKTILTQKFGIDWNELWSAIIKLHNSEILDVYSDEIVKVSDQVLASYAFYKCFIDKNSAVINYGEWIAAFMGTFSNRVRITLIDANNTFFYYHIKDLVLPHLNNVLQNINSDDKELYAFYKLFWFYKGRDCLLYLKEWTENLHQEQHPESINFSYVHNDHTTASKHFELLKGYWNQPNELLKPSLELSLALLEKQPRRLPEMLKFIHEDFKYKLEDRTNGYFRQNILLEVLLDDGLSNTLKHFANGIFLILAKALLGWHYSDYGSTKGNSFAIYNFDLFKSDELMNLRKLILNQFYYLFSSESEQCQKILTQIVYPGGKIDKSIYVDEMPIYQKIITEKLDITHYNHCKFVNLLAKHLLESGAAYPDNWNDFIESNISKISKFLKLDREFRDGKSVNESEKERRQEIDDFVRENDWQSLKKFLLNIDALYKQQKNSNSWQIQLAISDIYISLARNNKSAFQEALRLFFSSEVRLPLGLAPFSVALFEKIMTGEEFLNIINDYNFRGRVYIESFLLAILPDEQVNESFLILLLDTFQKSNEDIYIHRMLNYIKYEPIFDGYKKNNVEIGGHNIITYLTSIILSKRSNPARSFGVDFCKECSIYFANHLYLLKDVFWAQYEINPRFDYDGKELKAILDLDRDFINESLKNGVIGLGYSSQIRLENIYTDFIWKHPDYEGMIENILLTILDKAENTCLAEEEIFSLFSFENADENEVKKVKTLILKLTQKYSSNENAILTLVEIVYHNYRDWFIEYFKEFLLLKNDIKITKRISFGRGGINTGSWVPVYQTKIEFYQNIIKMINTLPNILDYSEHIDYFEQKITWKKLDIEREQKRDFMYEFY